MVVFKLDEVLKDNRRTARWLAQETGIRYSIISRILRNKTTSIQISTIEKICDALDCSIEDFMDIS